MCRQRATAGTPRGRARFPHLRVTLLGFGFTSSNCLLEVLKRQLPLVCQCRLNFPQKRRLKNSPLRCSSIASIATWQFDIIEGIKIEIDDGLQSLGGGVVAEVFWQGFAPAGVIGLQGEKLGDSVTPTLRSGASIDWPSIVDRGRRLMVPLTGAISGLPLGVAESVATFGAAASRHGAFSVT